MNRLLVLLFLGAIGLLVLFGIARPSNAPYGSCAYECECRDAVSRIESVRLREFVESCLEKWYGFDVRYTR